MAARYRRNAGSVFSLTYHLVWCPKYRRAVLIGEVADDCRALLSEKAAALGIPAAAGTHIHALDVLPDHVHVFVEGDPAQPVQYLVNHLKGCPSRILRQRYPSLATRLPSL